MNSRFLFPIVLAWLCAGAAVHAQAPANNSFANAEVIEDAFGSVDGTNVGANKQSGEPNHAGNSGGRSIWYAWTAPQTGYVVFDTSGSSDADGDDLNTLLAAYTGSAVNALTLIASNNDADPPDDVTSRMGFPCTAGVTYRIAVDGRNGVSGDVFLNWNLTTSGVFSFFAESFTGSEGSLKVVFTVQRRYGSEGAVTVDFTTEDATGANAAEDGLDYVGTSDSVTFDDGETTKTFEIEVSDDDEVEPQERFLVTLTGADSGAELETTGLTATGFINDDDSPPANDNFAAATTLSGTGSVPGRTSRATTQVGEPAAQNFGSGNTVWYRFVAPANGVLIFKLSAQTSFTLDLFQGTSLAGLTALTSNEIWPSTLGTVPGVQAAVSNGVTYYLRVDGYLGAGGEFTLGHAFATAGAFAIDSTLQSDGTWLAGTLDEDSVAAPLTVTVKRLAPSGGSAPATTVQYELVSDTATVGEDAAAASGTLNFAANQLSQTFVVDVLDDGSLEGTERVLVRLQVPGANSALGFPDEATVDITDNEDDPVNDQFADASVLTGQTSPVTGSIDGADREPGEPGSDPATVWYRWTAPVTGYASFRATEVGDAGQLVTTVFSGATLATLVPVVPGSGQNPGGAGQSTLVPVTAGESYFIQVGRNGVAADSFELEFVVTQGGFFHFAAASASVSIDEADALGQAALTITRTGGSEGPATVFYRTENGTAQAGEDFVALDTSVAFAAGETQKTVIVAITNDALNEGNQTFTMRITAVGGTASTGAPLEAAITIIDDDDDPLNDLLAGARMITGASGITAGTTAGADTEAPLEGGNRSVWFQWVAPLNGSVTFTATAAQLSAELKVFTQPTPGSVNPVSAQTTGAGTPQVAVNFAVTAGTSYFLALAQPQADTFELTWLLVGANSFQFSAANYSAAESDGTVTVTVTRTGAITTSATVSYAASAGSPGAGDFTAATGTLDFAADEPSRTFAVSITQDTIFELPETIQLTLSNPTAGATLGTPAAATLTVASDDPFVPGKGNFAGLIFPTAGPVVRGFFTITTTEKGGASGRVLLGGVSQAWKGNFDANGRLVATIKRPGGLAPLTLTLQLDDGLDRVTGTITDGIFTADLDGDRGTFLARTNETALQGRYTVVLDPTNAAADEPQGYGVATLVVSKLGVAKMTGTLADGVKFSAAALLSKDGRLPVYALLYAKLGSVFGELTFRDLPEVSDADATLLWSKPARPKDKRFQSAFTIDLPLRAARFQTEKGTPLLAGLIDSDGQATISFVEGNLPVAGLSDLPVSIGATNKVTVLPPNLEKLSVTLKSTNGTFSGRFTPEGEKTRTFKGVLFQKDEGRGYGLFLGPTQSGRVDLVPGS